MEPAKIKQMQELQAEYKKHKEKLKALAILQACNEGTLHTCYNVTSTFRMQIWHRLTSLPEVRKNDGSIDCDKCYAMRKEMTGNEEGKWWGVIQLHSKHQYDLSYDIVESMYELTDGLVVRDRWGTSSVWDDDTYYVMLVGVRSEEELPSVLNRIRQYCPNLKVEYTFQKTVVM